MNQITSFYSGLPETHILCNHVLTPALPMCRWNLLGDFQGCQTASTCSFPRLASTHPFLHFHNNANKEIIPQKSSVHIFSGKCRDFQSQEMRNKNVTCLSNSLISNAWMTAVELSSKKIFKIRI